jgi:putative transposase
MARQLRIEYPGAYYHVQSRGNQKQAIFLSDDDRHFFLACLREANRKFGASFHVYCLMTNHYHIFIETPEANLSKVMHSINTKYSIYLNRKHGRCGHPLQGRFQAILVEAEAYAQVLSRYIHLNPVRAGIVNRPEDYEWSSYPEYLGLRKQTSWMETAFILALFGSRPAEARKRYAEFVLSALGQTLKSPLSDARSKGILGSKAFIARITSEHLGARLLSPDRETPSLRKLKINPEMPEILTQVQEYLGVQNRHVRRAAIYITHRNTDYTLKQIGEFFDLGPSGISSACRKMKRDLMNNESLALALSEIEQRLFQRG